MPFYIKTKTVFALLVLFFLTGWGYAATPATADPVQEKVSYVAPSLSTTVQDLPDLTQYASGTPRKKAFLSILVPAIENVNRQIMADRTWLQVHQKATLWTVADRVRLKQICQSYDMSCDTPQSTDWNALLSRVDILPTHFVATQAAAESGWGTSKLAQSNNNLFGMRCGRNCTAQAGHVQGYYAYNSIEEGVMAYMKNLNTHSTYDSLRAERAKQRLDDKEALNTPDLISQLKGYSQKGDYYNRYLLQLYDSNKALISWVQKVDQGI